MSIKRNKFSCVSFVEFPKIFQNLDKDKEELLARLKWNHDW